MKRYLLLIGGAGARLTDALLCAVSAGVCPPGDLRILLADVDQRGVQGAAMQAAHLADYNRIRQAMRAETGPFSINMTFASWPESLPGDASTLSAFTTASEEDRLLCQALFDEDAAALDLHEGFHGRRSLAQVTFAGLLHEAANNPDDALMRLIADINADAAAGEDVRVVLAGSVCSGTGAAGIPALSQFIEERIPASVHMGAVLLTAVTDQQDATKAREALTQYALEGLCSAVCVLGLPKSSRPAAPAELARLTDWLAVYCMDVLLNRPVWLDGVFTVRAPEGPLSWAIFGKAAERYRIAYGRLFKAAVALVYVLGPEADRRMARPFFLRDLFGWYGHFYRRMEVTPEDERDMLAAVLRLMKVMLLWLGGLCKTLPFDLRHATALGKARQEAAAHYDALTELVSHLCVMDDDAQRNDDYDESVVHRHYTPEVTESEQTLRRIDAVKQEIARRDAEQVALNRKMGGASVMAMLEDALEAAETEARGIHNRYDEAVRRIDHAESIAAVKDQYRIIDARTKLQRMERHKLMLDSRLERVRADVAAAKDEETRFDHPAMTPTGIENALVSQKLAERLLQREPLSRAEVEAIWGRMICPSETAAFKPTLKALRRAEKDPAQPTVSLLGALMDEAMEGVKR